MADPSVPALRWTYVLVGVADGTLLPFLPLYLAERGMNAATIGAILAASALAWLVAGLGWAYLTDRGAAPERLVVAATVAAALSAVLLPFVGSAAAVAILMVVLTIVRSPLSLLDPIVLRRLRTASRTGYARIRLRMSAGWTASALASGALYQAGGLRLIPFVYAPLSIVVGVWVWRSVKPEPAVAADGSRPPLRVAGVPLAMLGFLLSCLLLGVSLAATQNFLTLQISDLGGGALLVGAAAAFQSTTEIPTMGYTHVLTRYVNHRVLFAAGCAIYLVVFVAWAFAGSALVAALLKLAVGVAFALTFVSAVMITNELVPARLRATGQALLKSVLFGVAPVAGALGGGLVYGALGPRVMFLAATVVVAAAGLVALVAVPMRRATGEEPALATNPATP